jgi:tetratricopeptide (TPR) repeat protein
LVEELCGDPSLRVEGLVLAGQLAESRGDFAEARRKLEAAAAVRDDRDLFPLRELCRFLFERIDPAEAGEVVQALARHEPDNPSAHANLGAYYHRVGDFTAAVASYLRSLELRPDAVTTRAQLAQALESAGDPEAARDHWRAVLEREPDHAQAAAAVGKTGG